MSITKEFAYQIVNNESAAISLEANKKSSGPGGQHVNKTESAIDLRYDFLSSSQLKDDQKQKILTIFEQYQSPEWFIFNTQKQKQKDPWLKNVPTLKFDKDGNLCITVKTHRSQQQNREESLDQLARLLYVLLQDEKERFTTEIPESIKKQKEKGNKIRLSQKNEYKEKNQGGKNLFLVITSEYKW